MNSESQALPKAVVLCVIQNLTISHVKTTSLINVSIYRMRVSTNL